MVQNIGVRTAAVTTGPAVQTLRTVGTVEVAEPNVHDINLRFSGWIEELYVDFVGAQVEEDEPLFTVYSPQLYAAEEEFLLAANARGDASLRASARDRLLNLGLTSSQIDELAASGTALHSVPIHSPVTGTVLTKHANAGMNVEPGMRAFRIADLGTVWVQVPIYESQLAGVRPGQAATMTVDALGGETFRGEVAFVDPTLDPMTRAARVRLAFANPDGRLKPGFFASVTLEQTLADNAVLAPREAVNATGTRSLVFVALGQGRFEPREVRTGANVANGQVVIEAGLAAGEKVVTSGQFLLDSEASVRASLARMVGGGAIPKPVPEMSRGTESAASSEMGPSAAADPGQFPVSANEQQAIDQLSDAYLTLQDNLTVNDATGAGELIARIADAAGTFTNWPLQPAAERVVQATAFETVSLDDLRAGFGPLSDAAIALLSMAPPSRDVVEKLYVTHCPMVNQDWLQSEPAIRNPYDPSMLTCGSVERSITAAAAPAPAGTTAPSPTNGAASPPAAQAEPAADAGNSEDAARDTLFNAYLSLQQGLIADDVTNAQAQLEQLRTAAATINAQDVVTATHIHTQDLTAFRKAFEALSNAVIKLAETSPPSTEVGDVLRVTHCPMVNANWLQLSNSIENPYDPTMLRCGVFRGEIQTK